MATRSLRTLHENHAYGPQKFGPPVQKTFATVSAQSGRTMIRQADMEAKWDVRPKCSEDVEIMPGDDGPVIECLNFLQ